MRKRIAMVAASTMCLLHGAFVGAAEKRVLIIGVDGMRPDSMEAADTPNLDALIANGGYSNKAQIGDITVSGPGWGTILTGVWRDKHGISNNSFSGKNLDAYPDVFTRVEAIDPSLETISIVHWSPINTQIVEGADFEVSDEPDGTVASIAADLLADGTARLGPRRGGTVINADPDLMFLHFDDVDGAGHASGYNAIPGSPYMNTIETTDSHIGTVMDALNQRPGVIAGEEDWLVIVLSDHGGTGFGHGPNTPIYRTIPFIVSGPSAKQGGVIHHTPVAADVVATALTHLDVAIDPAWGLDGRPAGMPTTTRYGQNIIFNGDAEWSTGYEGLFNNGSSGGNAVPATVPGWVEIDNLTVARYDAPELIQASDPGPTLRGDNYFVGGIEGDTVMTQTIDVADIAWDIDGGVVAFELSAYLGAQGDENDLAKLTANFLDETGGIIAQVSLSGDSAQRRRGETGLFRKSIEDLVPVGTRRVAFTLEMIDDPGAFGNLASADNLSMVFTMVPEPTTGVLLLSTGAVCCARWRRNRN